MKRRAPKVKFFYLCFLAIFVSFLGWIVENTFRAFCNRTIDSRFHLLPFLSPYGLIVFAYYLLLSDPDDLAVFGRHIFKQKTTATIIASNIIAWAGMCVTVFLGELAVGNFWYYVTGVTHFYGHFLFNNTTARFIAFRLRFVAQRKAQVNGKNYH